MIWVVLCLVQALSNQFLKGISRKYASADYCSGTASGRNGISLRFLVAGVYLLFYLIVHPLVFSLVTLMPALAVRIVVIAAAVLVGIDFFSVLYTLRTNRSYGGSPAGNNAVPGPTDVRYDLAPSAKGLSRNRRGKYPGGKLCVRQGYLL